MFFTNKTMSRWRFLQVMDVVKMSPRFFHRDEKIGFRETILPARQSEPAGCNEGGVPAAPQAQRVRLALIATRCRGDDV